MISHRVIFRPQKRYKIGGKTPKRQIDPILPPYRSPLAKVETWRVLVPPRDSCEGAGEARPAWLRGALKRHSMSFLLLPRFPICLVTQRLKKFKIALRDWNFQSRLKISSEPPTKPLFFVANSEGQDWQFQSRLKISSEIEIFNRDWSFSIFGPLGYA